MICILAAFKADLVKTINGTGLRRENFEMLKERIDSLVQTISNLANNSDVRSFVKGSIVQKIPALGGTPQVILIVAGWRTGRDIHIECSKQFK